MALNKNSIAIIAKTRICSTSNTMLQETLRYVQGRIEQYTGLVCPFTSAFQSRQFWHIPLITHVTDQGNQHQGDARQNGL
jgi:hypothetical protein